MKYTINTNTEYNSLEITFSEKPSEAIRTALKALKFRWHSVKHVWYGYADEAAVKVAIEGKPVEKAESKKPVTNEYGVSVGDIFYTSWGYEQTNVNFFQVVQLVGKMSVRVREVYLPMEDEKVISPMASDRTYKVVREMLPAATRSTFIEDQEKGDLKRLKKYNDGDVYFIADSFANACKVERDTITLYESWYA